MTIRRLVVAALCCLLAAQNDVSAVRLKGAREARLERRGLQLLSRPPMDDKTPAPKATLAPKTTPPTTTKTTTSHTEMYTWSSQDPPKSVHASVSRSKHDEAIEKLKTSKGTVADDREPKEKETQNRPPQPVRGSGKSSGATKGGGGGATKGGGGGSYDSADGSYDSDDGGGDVKGNGGGNAKTGGGVKGSTGGVTKGSGGGATKGSGNKANKKTKTGKQGKNKGGGGSGSSYDGGSDDAGKQNGGGNKDSTGGANKDSGSGPVTPQRPPLGQDEALTGVAVSRFALLYYIDNSLGMPMTSDYEAVHENTYLWLYTIMFREFGDQMRNLLTDDTSNIYEANLPVTIEYASVVLFAQGDPNIPTQAELDALVVSAFTGVNGETYVNEIQSLPRRNPFSSTTDVELQSVIPGEGRSVMGRIASRVSSKGMMPPLIAAAALFVFLAGGASVYKARQSGKDGGKSGKGGNPFDAYSDAGETETMTDEFTQSMATVSIKADQVQGRAEWDMALEEESHAKMSTISEEARDPDLASFFEGDAQQPTNEDNSQYSIEDFVNEAEKNLLGVRIRYPSTEGQQPSTNDTDVEQPNNVEMSTALVPAPPSAILPAASSAIVSRTSL